MEDERGLVGTVLAGCAIERLLGAGAMGEAYQGRRVADGLRVVVKVLAPEIAEDPVLRMRFQREGEALQKIRPHPAVMRIHDVQAYVEPPCLIVEFLDGASVDVYLQQRGRIGAEEALRFVREVALGMDVVHAHGLLHRDLKPANLMITPQGRPKIIDFGLAKDVFLTAMTEQGQMLGTANYLAAECWESSLATPAADIFALGVTLYELLTGKLPFEDANVAGLGDKIAGGDFVPASQLAPGLPPSVDALLLQLLNPEPRYRYAQMRDLAQEIDRVLRGEPCRIPCLTAGEQVYPLLPGKRFVLGSDARSDPRIEHPSVSLQHAQVRRKATGYELRDMKGSSGTFVNGEQVQGKVMLQNGDRLKLGELVLTFREPRQEHQDAAFLRDVLREERPDAVVSALTRLHDERVTLVQLERLCVAPALAREVQAILGTVVDAETAQFVAQQVAQEAPQRRTAAVQTLSALTQQQLPDEGAWLAWWDSVRPTAPTQLVPALPVPGLRLEVVAGDPDASPLVLSDQGLVLVGRDPKCHLRVAPRSVARLHATLLRLHARWFVRSEGAEGGVLLNGAPVQIAFVGAGDELTLGEVRIALRAAPPAPPPLRAGMHLVPDEWFRALVQRRHLCVARALVASLEIAQHPELMRQEALAVYPDAPPRAEQLARGLHAQLSERAGHAARLLPQLLGQDCGADVQRWRQLMESRPLPPQVQPAGWV